MAMAVEDHTMRSATRSAAILDDGVTCYGQQRGTWLIRDASCVVCSHPPPIHSVEGGGGQD